MSGINGAVTRALYRSEIRIIGKDIHTIESEQFIGLWGKYPNNYTLTSL